MCPQPKLLSHTPEYAVAICSDPLKMRRAVGALGVWKGGVVPGSYQREIPQACAPASSGTMQVKKAARTPTAGCRKDKTLPKA